MFSVAEDSHNKWMLGLYENVTVLLFPKYKVIVTASWKSVMCYEGVFIKAGIVQLHVMDSLFVPLLPLSGASLLSSRL